MASEPWMFMDRVDGVACPRCRGDLYLVLTSDSREGVSFGCPEGHALSIKEFSFPAPSQALRAGVRKLLGTWDEAAGHLAAGARLAEAEGHPEIADRLRRRIGSLRKHAQALRDFLSGARAASNPSATASAS